LKDEGVYRAFVFFVARKPHFLRGTLGQTMRKGHSIIGLQVISQQDAKNLGKVLDLVFDHDADECVALVLRERGFLGLGAGQVLPWGEIISIGKDAVMVKGETSVVNPQDHGRLQDIMEREAHLSGTRIMTEDGRDVGNFAEIYLDETSGKVMGYEVSGGFVSDTMSGKRYIPSERTDDLRVGQDVLLASPNLAEEFDRQATEEPGGLKGAYSSAKDKASDTYADVASASIERQKAFVVGKTAGRDVALAAPDSPDTSALANPTNLAPASQGELLVGQGQTITQEIADRAEQNGILHQLLLAVGATTASGALDATKERLAGAQQSLATSGSGSASGTSQSQEDLEREAIGKTAQKDVELPNGAFIVVSGMVITSDNMHTAKTYGRERELMAAAGVGGAGTPAQGVASQTGQVAANTWDSLKEKVAELTGHAQDRKAQYDDSAQVKKINHALGRPVTRIVLAKDDSVILNTGDIITNKAVEMARQNDVLDVLVNSVYDATPDITPEMMRATQPGVAALEEQVQPPGQPITATVQANQQAQDTPSQGQTATR